MDTSIALLTTIGSSLAWYDLVYLPCLLLFVHPEKVIDLLSDLPGKKSAVPSVRTFQVAAAIIVVVCSLLLFSFSSAFRWSHLIAVVLVALIARGIRTLIVRYFGFEKF